MPSRLATITRGLSAFLSLAFRPIPKIGNLVNRLLAVLGLGVGAVVGWVTTPGSHKIVIQGHVLDVPGSSHWPLAVAGALLVLALLFLVAGLRVQGIVASRPRLAFAGTDKDRREVLRGFLPISTLSAYASGGPTTAASAAVIDPAAVTLLPSASRPKLTGDKAKGRGARRRREAEPLQAAPPETLPNEYVRVLVRNEPISGFGPPAEHVAARIQFLELDQDTVLLEISGRWAEAPQRLDTGHIGITHAAEQLTIHANGTTHELDIALKAPGDTHFYASNDENSQAINHRLPPHRLDVSGCRVRVSLRAANAPSISGLFFLTNDAEHGLTLLESEA